MILAETLECTVPSPNAVKDAVISCVTEATNLSDIWGASAAVIGAATTMVLAIFAVRAWHIQRATLQRMEEQIVQSAKSATDALNADVESRQIEALGDYVGALYTLLASLYRGAVPASEQCKIAVAKGLTWRMHHWAVREESKNAAILLQRMSGIVYSNCKGRPGEYLANWKDLGIPNAIDALIAGVLDWQSSPEKRTEAECKMLTAMGLMRESNKFIFDARVKEL